MSYVYEMNPEDSSNSENEFDRVIEEDVDQDNVDKENIQRIRTRSTKIQLRILDDKMNACSDDIDDDGWHLLHEKLNDAGPPIRTLEQWKRIWSSRKYNKKLSNQDHQTCSKPSGNVSENPYVPATSVLSERQEVVSGVQNIETRLQRMEIGLQKVEAALQKTNSILETKLDTTNSKLDTTNSLLEKITNK